jgi:photosystem II stability/assembly factor-like uncharacterized protein
VLQTNTTQDLRSIWFASDGRRGWVASAGSDPRMWTVGLGLAITDDGGASWRQQVSSSLVSVFFLADGMRGWAAGTGGTIFATDDGGQNWRQANSETKTDLTWIRFLPDGRRGWAGGGVGTLLSTQDGGQTWKLEASGVASRLYAGAVLPNGAALAVGADGVILRSGAGSNGWKPMTLSPRLQLYRGSLQSNGSRAWLVGNDGLIVKTGDGGQTWSVQNSGTNQELHSVAFSDDSGRGWASGVGSKILSTLDGGTTWEASEPTGGVTPLHAITFLSDGQRGWGAGDTGIFATRDGGRTWERQADNREGALLHVAVDASGQRGWAGGDGGLLMTTTNGGSAWQISKEPSLGRIFWVEPLADGQTAWLATETGLAFAAPEGARTVHSSKDPLVCVWFLPDGVRGWAVGFRGTLLATQDGGRTWKRRASGAEAPLGWIGFSEDGSRGIIGGVGEILTTSDGGQTWVRPQYAIHPAPWYLALAVLCLVPLGAAAFVRIPHDVVIAPEPQITSSARREPPSIAELGISDRPIGWADRDCLMFKPIARSLSRLLRNADTEPPLTIGITGRWGSGKSSLMNLLKEELEGWSFRPVWFNVWHHQQEEQMLAALLEAIRRQMVPPALSFDGAVMRARLLFSRSKGYWFALGVALVLLGFVAATIAINWDRHDGMLERIAYEAGLSKPSVITEDSLAALEKTQPEIRSVAQRLMGRVFRDSEALVEAIEGELKTAHGASYRLTAQEINEVHHVIQHVPPAEKLPRIGLDLGALLALLVALPLSVLAVLKGVSAFGISPLNLFSLMRSHMRVKQFTEQLGFRHRFAEEFALVTQAVRPKTLLVIIDDLDRCTPENVVKVLEMVNFLVTSGKCFIVIGMDRQWVEGCVALHYEKVAEMLGGEFATGAARPGVDAKTLRLGFARRYLEKLINVEVPIPQPEPHQVQRLLLAKGMMRSTRARLPLLSAIKGLVRGLRMRSAPRTAVGAGTLMLALSQAARSAFGRRSAIAALVVAALLLPAVWVYTRQQPPAAGAETVRPALAQDATAAPSAPRTGNQASPPAPRREQGLVAVVPGSPASLVLSPVGLSMPLLALALLAAAYVAQRARHALSRLPKVEMIVQDTKDFADALEMWQPWVVHRNNTPRSVKSFKNRVRYLAGIQRTEPAPRNLFERMLAPAKSWMGARPDNVAVNDIPEPLLVALAAVHHADPAWVMNDDKWKLVASGMVTQLIEDERKVHASLSIDGPSREEKEIVARVAHQLREAIDRFERDFTGLWPPSPEQRRRFVLMASGLRARVEDESQPGIKQAA